MRTRAPLRKSGVIHVKDHMLNMLAVSVGFSVFESRVSSGEMHSSIKERRPRKRTANFKGTSSATENDCA